MDFAHGNGFFVWVRWFWDGVFPCTVQASMLACHTVDWNKVYGTVGQSVRVTTISVSHADHPFLRPITPKAPASNLLASDFPPLLPPGNEGVSLDPRAVVQVVVKTPSSILWFIFFADAFNTKTCMPLILPFFVALNCASTTGFPPLHT